MQQWFPAIRAALTRGRLRLPQPYPHTVRTLLGSALAALLSGAFIGIFYLAYSLSCFTMNMVVHLGDFFAPTSVDVVDTANTGEATAQADRKILDNKVDNEGVPDIAPRESRASLKSRELPYSEYRNLSFSEAARQVDFALVQTVLRLNIERGRIVLLTSEYREQGDETYQYQRMRIFLPPVADPSPAEISAEGQQPRRVAVDAVSEFVGTLEENLDVWASKGILHEQPGKITLSVDKVITHEIWLDVTSKSFVPVSEADLQHHPRLSIVINDLGHSLDAVDALLALPVPITLGVDPSGALARETAEAAWKAGHEVIIHQPMQSVQSPYVTAGPDELGIDMPAERIAAIIHKAQGKVPHASGLTNRMGSRLDTDQNAVARVVRQIAAAGLYLLDDMASQDSLLYSEACRLGLAAWQRNLSLDDGHPSESIVRAALKQAEQLAMQRGYAVVTGHPYPETMAALRLWVQERNSDLEIVPVHTLPIVLDK